MTEPGIDIIGRTDPLIDHSALNDLTEAIGWGRRSDEQWREILERSKYVYSLFSAGKLVAFGRVLEDGTMAMFYDIAVHPDFQGKGLACISHQWCEMQATRPGWPRQNASFASILERREGRHCVVAAVAAREQNQPWMADFAIFLTHAKHACEKYRLGTRVMKHLLDQVRGKGYASVGLFAWDKNPGALKFYERLGFNRVDFGMKLKP